MRIAQTLAALAAVLTASGCAAHRGVNHASSTSAGAQLVPDGWNTVTVAVVPDVWHVAGEPSNSMANGVSPGPYTYVPVPDAQARRIAAEINAGAVDTLLPHGCMIGLAYAHLVFHYPRRDLPVLIDPNCGDASREDVDDNKPPMRKISPALKQEVLAVAPAFAATAGPG